jgi:hypothetical protein
MTYLPNIPQGDNSPKNQAPLIQTDFSKFASVFSTTIGSNKYNHSPVNTMNQGDHETIMLQDQVTTDPTINDNFACLYAKDASSKVGTQPQLFLRIPKYLPNQFVTKNAPNTPMQLTYNQVNTTGPIYQSFLAGGYLLFWGTTTITSPNVSKQITLPLATTQILIAIAYPNLTIGSNLTTRVSTTIDSTTKFTIYLAAAITGIPSPLPLTFLILATV